MHRPPINIALDIYAIGGVLLYHFEGNVGTGPDPGQEVVDRAGPGTKIEDASVIADSRGQNIEEGFAKPV